MEEITQTAKTAALVGRSVKQVRTNTPGLERFVGRTGTVAEAFLDEEGSVHVRTREDGVWCPVALCEVL